MWLKQIMETDKALKFSLLFLACWLTFSLVVFFSTLQNFETMLKRLVTSQEQTLQILDSLHGTLTTASNGTQSKSSISSDVSQESKD